MYSTKFGPFDGDSWEALMQICFRIKYENEHYQPVPASPGDYGIEGWTQKGKVFQCYCPDNNLSSADLYEKQRDKITKDIGKLKLHKKMLEKILNGIKIREWIFVTPDNRMNDLILHCNKKTEEALKFKLPFIDDDFKVIVHDIDNFAREIPIALNPGIQKLHIDKGQQGHNKLIEWKDQQIDLVANAIRKHSKRFPSDHVGADMKVNQLTNNTITSFLDQGTILTNWERLHPDDFEKFLILCSEIETEVIERCMFPSDNNNELYKSLWELVHQRFALNFSYLSEMTLRNLTHGAMADWVLRCPLDFE